MQNSTLEKSASHELDEEFVDTLIAISVIAKRLAKKINEKRNDKGDQSCTENILN